MDAISFMYFPGVVDQRYAYALGHSRSRTFQSISKKAIHCLFLFGCLCLFGFGFGFVFLLFLAPLFCSEIDFLSPQK